MSKIESYYQKLPLPLQNISINLKSLNLKYARYNTTFKTELKNYLSNYNNNQIKINSNELQDFIKAAEKSYYWKFAF